MVTSYPYVQIFIVRKFPDAHDMVCPSLAQ